MKDMCLIVITEVWVIFGGKEVEVMWISWWKSKDGWWKSKG
jgi:hypothetical protein